MKEIKHRIEDAVGATKAAIEEGVVAGGGIALIRAASVLDSLKLEGEEAVAIQILKRAIEEPLKKISENAGHEGAVVVSEVKKEKGNFGFNAQTGEYGDMIKMGIIDPAKVTRTALENAVSIAGIVLTTEASVVPKKEEKPEIPQGGGMGGMY
jgi:chaperonin GroEL